MASSTDAETVNKFFADKIAKVSASTDNAPPTYTHAPTEPSMCGFSTLSVDDIISGVHQLPDKSSTADPLPTFVLKQIIDLIAPFVTELFRCSLATGRFPSQFKDASITPIVKKVGLDPSDASSYRPISNLAVLSKLLERLIASQLMDYLTSADLLPSLQTAFTRVIVRVLSDILQAINHGDFAALVLLDLSAAFNTVDHKILIQRLQSTYSIHGSVLQWFRSYLLGITQHVCRGSARSSAVHLVCGVPEGSVISPIFFILYTADLVALTELEAIYTVGFVIIYLIENNMYVFLVLILTLAKYHVEFHKVQYLDPCYFYCTLTILVTVYLVQLLNYLQMTLICLFTVNQLKICKL